VGKLYCGVQKFEIEILKRHTSTLNLVFKLPLFFNGPVTGTALIPTISADQKSLEASNIEILL